jgi:hypothetical protein
MSEARRHRAAVVALVLVAIVSVSSGPARSTVNAALSTLFPGRATLQVAPGNVRVQSGSPLGINARMVNGGAASAQVEIGDGKRWRTLDMTTAADGRFQLRLDAVTIPLAYRVLAAGLTSPTYAIEVVFPPRVARIDLEYAYPAETGVRPWTEEDTGDIYGPPGTQVRVHVHTDRPAATGQLALEDGEKLPLSFEHATELTVVLRVQGDNVYRVALAGPDGLTSTDDSSHLIRVVGGRK